VDQPLRLQGQYEDPETGLYYNRHRYFEPQLGAFISQDPLGLYGGTNLYQYAPNTTGWLDPWGLKCLSQAEVDALKKLVNSDPDRAYFMLRQMIRKGDLDFSTARDAAVFWSGKNMKTAQDWAQRNGKMTLEQTSGGKVLDELGLFQNPNFDNKNAAKLWNMASNKFASQASGTVNGFSTGATRIGQYGERTWWRIEKPILQNNDDVDAILRLKKDGMPAQAGHLGK
jgi:RHS repeat-associated protein